MGTTNGGAVSIEESKIPVTSLTVYPNPAEEIITVELRNSVSNISGSIYIYDMLGQRDNTSKNLQSSKSEMNVSSFPSGIYFVKYVNQGYTESGKFIKN